jgi:hypothetical protein
MTMSNEETSVQRTQHAFLVAWGWFAEEAGLIDKIQAVALKQKTCTHSPQSKVLEFVIGTLLGCKGSSGLGITVSSRKSPAG